MSDYLIRVDGGDYAAADLAASLWWCNSKPGKYGQGLGRTEGDPWKPTRTGILGQMAFAEVFNQDVDLTYQKNGDQYDFLIGGKSIDVKCAMSNYGANLMQHTNELGRKIELKHDIYVCSYVEEESRDDLYADIMLVGFLTKEEVEKAPVKKGRRGGRHLNYELSFKKTHSILELERYLSLTAAT